LKNLKKLRNYVDNFSRCDESMQNVATYGTVSSSPVDDGGLADRIIDNNPNGVFSAGILIIFDLINVFHHFENILKARRRHQYQRNIAKRDYYSKRNTF